MKDQNINILVLEDDPATGRQIAQLLRQQGYDVITDTSAHAAELLNARKIPSLIICDTRLRSISSHQFLIELRNNAQLKHVPFIYVNGKTGREHARFAMNLGADDYLPAPINSQDLLMSAKARLARFSTIISYGMQHVHKEEEEDLPQPGISMDLADKLSKTEFKIYRMVASGLTAQQISQEMSISLKTLENHRYNISKKLNISGHYGLLHYVIRNQVKRYKK